MLRKIFAISFFILFALCLQGQQLKFDQKIIESNLYFLASDSLKGRFPGTPEDLISASFIRDHFSKSGLKPLNENGFQKFNVTTSVEASSDNVLYLNGISGTYGSDYSLHSFSSNGTFESEAVFAGFGMSIKTDSVVWNDYKNLDVKDKWVVVLKGDPEPENNNSIFIPFADARNKALFAKDNGAVGILFVGGVKNNPSDELAPMLFERSVVSAGLPAIDLKKSWADSVLSNKQIGIDSLEQLMIAGIDPSGIQLRTTVKAKTELIRKEVSTMNVVGLLEGNDPVLKDEYILIGAHYDHLGMGGTGSGSRTPDTLAPHVGADDNGSGVVGVMALASALAEEKNNLQRSVLFVAFGAEEMGLLGSRYFVDNLPVSKEKVVGMINFDMIGRLNEQKTVVVGGTGTAKETENLLDQIAESASIKLTYSPEGFGASDHASFYAENIPVMFFSTGAHSDYHTPSDTPDKINYDGMTEVLDLVGKIALEIINRDERLTFSEAGPKERTSARRGFKVTLGIMPDFTSSSNDGLGVGGVTKGGPADIAGMKKGDKITSINGMSVGTIYDYMNRLRQLKPGQRVNVDVVRDGDTKILIVDL
jgi:aminopeptidase YwaD